VAILDAVIHSDPNILGGTPVFRGTRVPLKNLVDYLAAGDSLDEFLDHFPSVKREQAKAVLELAAKELRPLRPTASNRSHRSCPNCLSFSRRLRLVPGSITRLL
jgi:uncharacterized protein (DUF433 family)